MNKNGIGSGLKKAIITITHHFTENDPKIQNKVNKVKKALKQGEISYEQLQQFGICPECYHMIKKDLGNQVQIAIGAISRNYSSLNPRMLHQVKIVSDSLMKQEITFYDLEDYGLTETCYNMIIEDITDRVCDLAYCLFDKNQYFPEDTTELKIILADEHATDCGQKFIKTAIDLEIVKPETIIITCYNWYNGKIEKDAAEKYLRSLNQLNKEEEEEKKVANNSVFFSKPIIEAKTDDLTEPANQYLRFPIAFINTIPKAIRKLIPLDIFEMIGKELFQRQCYNNAASPDMKQMYKDFLNLLPKQWLADLSAEEQKLFPEYLFDEDLFRKIGSQTESIMT